MTDFGVMVLKHAKKQQDNAVLAQRQTAQEQTNVLLTLVTKKTINAYKQIYAQKNAVMVSSKLESNAMTETQTTMTDVTALAK